MSKKAKQPGLQTSFMDLLWMYEGATDLSKMYDRRNLEKDWV